MRPLLLVQHLVHFTEKRQTLTYGIFFLSLVLASIKGYLVGPSASTSALIGFLDHWEGASKKVFDAIVTFLYQPLGTMMWLFFVFALFLWLLFLSSGARGQTSFRYFILPFLGLSYFGIIVSFLAFALKLSSIPPPYWIVVTLFTFWLVSYSLILMHRFERTALRSICTTLLCFFIVFPLGGLPAIAPYFQWI